MMAVILTLVALAAATLSGMTGLGGGTVLIAALYAAGLAPAVAVPLHAGVQLVSNGTRTLAYLTHVDWRGLALFLVGAAPAPFLVAPLVVRADADLLRLVMAGFVVLATMPGLIHRARLGGAAGLVAAGAISGGAGMVVGATGLLIAPFFLREDWSKETVIASMAVCQTLVHLLKIAAFAWQGFGLLGELDLLVPMSVAVIAGTLLGRRMVGLFDERLFRIVFRIVLLSLAARLAYDGVTGLLGVGG
ncbi:hypothetical protein PC39_03522 [Salinisphaera sp. PC39]|uniref:sulfite exporter TauE/SafE family protein n=1 Tax=Salinisphaera sp. PC39 TaxID=1304156 RepID=UPI00333F3656